MRKFKKVLAIIEPRQLRQVALERALALSQISKNKIQIVAVMPVYDFSWDLSTLLSVEQEDEMKASVIKKHKKWLSAYLQIHAMGYEIEQHVIWSKTIGKDITQMTKEIGADIIFKASDVHGLLDSVLFTPLDWQLLRNAPVPVLIAKDHIWRPTGIIAVAVDLSATDEIEDKLSNIRLLREAQELAYFTRCEIHLLNAIPPVLPPASIDLPGITPDLLGDAALKEGCRAVLEFAQRHRIPPENCHIREGQADEVIPTLCKELNPTALFIGTSARKGVALALVGNICERVSDEVDCDIAVVTPKAVLRQIPIAQD